MADVVNIADLPARDLPAHIGYALAVRELITLSNLAGSTLLAGAGGLDQIVARVNVIEVPDILPWVRPNELLLTTGFAIRFADSGQPFDPQELEELMESWPAAVQQRWGEGGQVPRRAARAMRPTEMSFRCS